MSKRGTPVREAFKPKFGLVAPPALWGRVSLIGWVSLSGQGSVYQGGWNVLEQRSVCLSGWGRVSGQRIVYHGGECLSGYNATLLSTV